MYLQFHTMKEPSKNHDICVRDLFGSLRGRDRFSSVFSHFLKFIFGFEFGSVLGKTWVLVRFVLAGFRFFPISIKEPSQQ